MGQTHRTFQRPTQSTHHLLTSTPPQSCHLNPPPNSVISTGGALLRRSGEIPALVLFNLPQPLSFRPKRSVVEKPPHWLSFTPAKSSWNIKQNPTQPCHLDLSNVEGPRFCAVVEKPPHWLSVTPAKFSWNIKQNPTQPCHLDAEERRRTALCAAAERSSNCFSSNPPQPCHLDRRRAFCAVVERSPNWLSFIPAKSS